MIYLLCHGVNNIGAPKFLVLIKNFTTDCFLCTFCIIYANRSQFCGALKVIYHPLYSMNKFVTNKSNLLQYGAQLFLYMG